MLRAGSARCCLTPREPFYLIGYGPRYQSRRQPAEGIHDDIYGRAVLLEVDGTEIFLFNADMIEFEEWSCDEIRKSMAEEYGLNEDCILLSATHNHHSVMSYHKHWNTGVFSQTYYDFFVDSIKRAYEECREHLEPCEMFFGRGRVTGCYGSRIFLGEEADNEVILAECRNEKGEVTAALCNWATHSTVLDPENTLLTADYAGAVCEALHRLRGYYPAMIVGAAGDCSNRGFRQGTDFKELERLAEKTAFQIHQISCTVPLRLYDQGSRRIEYRVCYTPENHRDQVQAEIDGLMEKAKGAENAQEKKLLYDAAGNLSKLLDQSKVDLTLSSQILRLGDLELVSSQGELGSALGIELKAHSRAKCCLICGYTNGYKSYILQPELYPYSARCRASKYRACDVRGYIDCIKENM